MKHYIWKILLTVVQETSHEIQGLSLCQKQQTSAKFDKFMTSSMHLFSIFLHLQNTSRLLLLKGWYFNQHYLKELQSSVQTNSLIK